MLSPPRPRPHAVFLACALAALALLLTSCGEDTPDEPGGKGGDSPAGQSDIPKAKEPVTKQVERLDAVVAAKDCEGQIQLAHSYLGDQKPGPPTKEDCGFAAQVAKDLKKIVPFETSESKEFGTAAATDVTKGGKPSVILWLLDTDGRYKFLNFAPLGEPELSGETTPKAKRPDANAEAFVDAIRKKDCDATFRLLSSDSVLVTARNDDKKLFCKDFEGAYAAKESFFAQAVANRDAKPVLMGETDSFGFYGLRLGPETFYTLVFGTEPVDAPNENHEDFGMFQYVPAQKQAE